MNAIHPPPRRVITHEDEDKKDKDGDKKKEEETMNAIHPPPRRVITYEDEDKKDKDGDKKKEEERSLMLQKAGEAHLVVAALITTVTFAAGITMPGGFAGGGEGSHPGSALLRRNAAFKAFVITDAISMMFSSVAVFIHLLTPVFLNNNCDKEMHFTLVSLAFNLIVLAMLAMGLAFGTGTYAVLEPSLGLAIPNLILGSIFLYILSFVFLSVLQRRRRKPGDH